MPKQFLILTALICTVSSGFAQPASALLNRSLSSGIPPIPLGVPSQSGEFLTDEFMLGAAGEDWVIDSIRVWGMPDPRQPFARFPGDLFKSVVLRGGLSTISTVPGTADCDCHGLLSLKTASLIPGGLNSSTPEVRISSVQSEDRLLWQLDFTGLLWSVPGGAPIRFGVAAEGRPAADGNGPLTWDASGSPSEDSSLKVFSADGKASRLFKSANPARINIQVQAHLLAHVSLRQAGKNYQLVLKAGHALEAGDVDPATLRLGPHKVAPDSVTTTDVDGDGKPDVLAVFRISSAAVPPGSINVCLSGSRRDGTPFEGCDLLPGYKAR